MKPDPLFNLFLCQFWTKNLLDSLQNIIKAIGEIINNDEACLSLLDDVHNSVGTNEAESSRNQHILDIAHFC